MGISPEKFRRSYNAQVGQVDKSWRVAEFDIEVGTVNNTFNAKLGGAAHIVGVVDKASGNLIDLMLIVGGGKREETLRAIAATLSAAQAVTQGASKEAISKAVTTLMSKAMEDMDKPKAKTASAIVGNRKYSASASQLTGLMFAISNANS